MKTLITSIAIGGFDGMHIAHQELFKKLDDNGAIVVIETGYANLTPKTNRAKYTTFPLFYYPLLSIKHLSPYQFISLLKEEYQNLKKIVIGFDFKFGANASGSLDTLKDLFDGEIEVIEEFFYENIAVHSRVIRDFISCGEVFKANKLLGKNYQISGLHIRGQGLGKKQFIPTINIECKNFLLPSSGIYSSFTIIANIKYLSVTFVGHRVSTDGLYAIETHLIGEVLDIVPSKIEIEFVEKIRENQKYDDLDELKKQILNDIATVKDKNYASGQ